MPRFSTKTVNAMLIKATGIKGYVPQGLKTAINRTKISSNFGPKRVKDVLGGKSNPNIDQNTLNKIFEKIDETGTLKTSWAESKEKFTREVAKQQRIEDRQQKIDKQIEQKNQETAQKTVKPKDENITQARRFSVEGDRRRQLLERGLIRKEDQVYEAGKEFRDKERIGSGVQKEQEKKYNIGMRTKFGGKGEGSAEGKGGLIGHAVEEEKKEGTGSSSSSKSGQKKGGNAPASQKSGGHQPVKLQGSAGIDQLTHRQEISKGENLPGGIYHVKGLDKAPASQPETPPAPRSATDINDITDLDIG